MARGSSATFRAVGVSLDMLAQTMRGLPRHTKEAFAYAASGVLQQAGVVVASHYIVPGRYMDEKGNYIAPPGATHGPVKYSNRDASGNLMRNSKGQFIYAPKEKKLFVKGAFVSRTGEMMATAKELAGTAPTTATGVTLAFGTSPKSGGNIDVGVDAAGNGYITLTGGYRAAEAGSRATTSNGVKGWWRALRSAQGRYATLLAKKYPDLLRLSP